MRKVSMALLAAGFLCLLLALGLVGRHWGEQVRAQAEAERDTQYLHEQIVPDVSRESGVIPAAQPMMTEIALDGRQYVGLLTIPALGREVPVQDGCSAAQLKHSPCRYSGGPGGHFVIAGHNYRAHFAALSALEQGDMVFFTDADGNLWRYSVVQTEVLEGTDVAGMLGGSWDLTLFTCTRGGSARIAARCVLADRGATGQNV